MIKVNSDGSESIDTPCPRCGGSLCRWYDECPTPTRQWECICGFVGYVQETKGDNMAIELPPEEVITIPPKEAVVADKLWMTQLLIRTPGPDDANSLVLEYQPWTGAGEPIRRTANGNDTTKVIQVTDVFTVAAEVPEMAQAMGAILAAIPALIAYVNAKQNSPE